MNINQLIKLSGGDYDPEIIEYGLNILKDTLCTSFVILILGYILGYFTESIIFLIVSMTGTSTLGGASLC